MRTFLVRTILRSVIIPVVSNTVITCCWNKDNMSLEIFSDKQNHTFRFELYKNDDDAYDMYFEPKIQSLNDFLSDDVSSTHVIDLTDFDLQSYELEIK